MRGAIQIGASAALLSMGLTVDPAAAQTDSPWLNWVIANSPHGYDITSDGTIWINVNRTGQVDDYAIRAEDVQAARQGHSSYPTFWVRGYHKRNTKVTYRETKSRMEIDCKRETLSTSTTAYYAEGGRFLWQDGAKASSYIIPGTFGAEYHRLLCIVQD